MMIKNIYNPIVMLVVHVKNTPNIRKIPTINSIQGIIKAAKPDGAMRVSAEL